MTITQIKHLISKSKIKSQDAAILLIYAIENKINPACVLITEQDIQQLSKEGIIIIDKKGNPKVNYELLNGEKQLDYTTVYDAVSENIDQYRQVWKGLFTGSMGTPSACIDKITEWLINNPNYSFDNVVTAASYWIEQKSKEVDNPMIIGQADYFIYKKVDGVVTSRLSSIIDEALNNYTDESFDELIN